MVTIVGSLTSGVGVSGGCLFGSLNVPGEVVNASSIRCVVPAGKAGRVVSVQVKNAVSDPDSGTGRPYRYHAQVRMNAAWPTRGSKPGGTVVSITGSGFDIQANLACRFGLMPVLEGGVQFLTSSLITCVSPATDAVGSVALVLADSAGADTSTGFEFLYEESATVYVLTECISYHGGRLTVHGIYLESTTVRSTTVLARYMYVPTRARF